jgi:AI-2E family transporter
MNAAVGIGTAIAMYLCGLGDPLLWGAVAFLLNYIPILGPLFGTGIFLLAGMLSFDNLWAALLPPVLYFGLHLVEGETLTPMLYIKVLHSSSHQPRFAFLAGWWTMELTPFDAVGAEVERSVRWRITRIRIRGSQAKRSLENSITTPVTCLAKRPSSKTTLIG